MARYIYSISVDFPHGVLTGQLSQEVVETIPVPALYDISANDGVVTISFASSISDVSILDNIVSNHFPVYYQTVIGDTQIGDPYNPSKLAVGEGFVVNSGVCVLSNSNMESGTWVDNTNTALTHSDISFNIFQGTAPGNCFYLGYINFILGFGIKITTPTLSIIAQSKLIWEYWNGIVWTSFNVMQTDHDTRHVYINSFLSYLSTFHIRFGLTVNTPYALKTIFGHTMNWVRLRVVTIIPSIPLGENVKIHTSSIVINPDGYLEHFGNSRIFKNEKIDYYPDTSLPLPSTQEIFLAPGLNFSKPNNSFFDSVLTRVGFNFKVPVEMDISLPMKINIGFVCDSALSGNIQWTLKYTFSNTNTPLYLISTDATTNPNPDAITVTKITPIPINNNKKNLNETISIDCSLISSNPSTSDKFFFYGSLSRNAINSNPSDTYPGSAFLVTFDYDYIAWSSGGYILGF
jgi:hypothetical protein